LAGAARSGGTVGADPVARHFIRRGQAAQASIALEVAAPAVIARTSIAQGAAQEVAAVAAAAEAIAPEAVVAEEVAAVAATAPEAIHRADASEADRDFSSRVLASSR